LRPLQREERLLPEDPPKSIEGELVAGELRFAFVAARFNDFVVEPLIRGALDALKRHGATEKQIEIVRVPGAFDIPIVARKLALSRRYDALIALGAVIRGETPHFDYVAGECASGLARIALESGVPIAFGVLTTDNVEQAVDRAGGKAGNKGADAALAAVEMANLLRRLDP
jgi:6,7-dimethyl-8-ribityllumazine synthase